ncbi:tyrosine-type recombinase/integrase [Meiothermus granaticius]|uniref:Transposase n=1 Tax=Meiothermus granaticius NBRC 107808 TaxID=1227551 RepID=A0A399FEP2_9DEIN|nr:site-specific integrase [Meiothermus granaticius]MCL6527344.1 site-specific integrase [Thermaceae bacterium]RIH93461.1 Transposase [Meiothermus granaticius NBRC 107808]GEM85954.1 site-specific integrase [Meiothermus granaticius NBRC 107808]
MPKKRGNHEGTVYKRESDGKWVGAVTLGHNAQGNPKRKAVYGATRAEAAKKLADLLDKFNKGLLATPATVTVEEFTEAWKKRELVSKAQKTRSAYEWELSHALRHLGKLRVQSVQPVHIRRMLDSMTEEGWTPKPTKAQEREGVQPEPRPYTLRTQKMVLQRMRSVFQDAVRLELIHRNPCEAVKVSVEPSEPVGRVLDTTEMVALLKACDALLDKKDVHPMGMLFRLMLDTGLRKGEALALTWADLDLEAHPPRLSVGKSWSNLKGVRGGIMTKPKSRTSKRVVPIPPGTAARLRALREHVRASFGQDVQGLYLFGSPLHNTPFEPNAPNHALTRICEREGLRHIRPHDLRHTYGSVLLANGVKLEVVSKRMGHANPTVTLNVYRHLLEGELFENVFEVSATAAPAAPESPDLLPHGLPDRDAA